MPGFPKRHSTQRRRRRLAPPKPYVGPRAVAARVGRAALRVSLEDGRILIVPFRALPGLATAPAAARRVLELAGGGVGIHFPLCDEDISVANLLQPELSMHYERDPRRSRARS